MTEPYLWSEKYRPHKIEDCILPETYRKHFEGIRDSGEMQNLLLCGGPGVGKTTIAKALCEEMECDCLIINGSLDRNIDTLRNEIMSFASSVSFDGKKKVVIIDEADGTNPESFQKGLRHFIEEFSTNCRFILTANFKNKLIAPLHSRCSVIEFIFKDSDLTDLGAQFFKRLCWILKTESVAFDKKIVATLLQKYFPDFRRTLNEIQKLSTKGKIDESVFVERADIGIAGVFEALKSANFVNAKKWTVEHSNYESSEVFRSLYDNLKDYVKPQSIPKAVLLIAEYQYKAAFAVDSEINTLALLVELMVECEFK